MKSFGNRINLVLQQIHQYGPFHCLADIGSDHAYVAVEAMQRGDVHCSIAADINAGPLERGRQNAKQAGVDVQFCLSDGFDSFPDVHPDCICICGMGGELIADIIRRGSKFTKDSLLLLQPMTAHDDLRRFLWDHGFAILSEDYTEEGKKPYVLITAKYCETCESYDYWDLFLGKQPVNTAYYRSYASKVAAQCEKRKKGLLAQGKDFQSEEQLLQRCLSIINDV